MSIEPLNGATTHGNEQAQDLGLTDIPAEHLAHIINVGFSERFMGAKRIRGDKGFAWRNQATGVAELRPFDVTRDDGKMLAGLRLFCQRNLLVWELEENGSGVTCRIGRAVGMVEGEAAQLAAVCTPVLGVTIALSMLTLAGTDFKDLHRQLYEDAPRLHLDA